MKFESNYNLTRHNTFGINAKCNNFFEYQTDEELFEFIREHKKDFENNYLILGSGSNILFTKDFDGLIIHPETKGKKIIYEKDDSIYVEAQAGEIWDEFVDWTIMNNIFGLENLSHIPGTVGASAVQNIGAYGAEAGKFIHRVKFLHIDTGDIQYISNEACCFAYRESIFKKLLKNKAIILSVVFKLQKTANINKDYADVEKYLIDNNIKDPTPATIRQAIISIRKQKLPDPSEIGSAGSFFKNPIIDINTFNILKEKFPEIRYYIISEKKVKIAAGWLIDQCNLKGFKHRGAAVHKNQALVLINADNAEGSDILKLSEIVKNKVFETFGINIEPEAIII